MIITKQRGFTIIELIVVIAIIAVLARIVLVNVSSYNVKGKDAAIKANMETMLKMGTIYYATNSTYYKAMNDDFCAYTSPNLGNGLQIVIVRLGTPNGTYSNISTASCPSDGKSWCFCAPLATKDKSYCVDSTGLKKEVTNTQNYMCGGTCASGACQ